MSTACNSRPSRTEPANVLAAPRDSARLGGTSPALAPRSARRGASEMTVCEAIHRVTASLSGTGTDTPRLDAEVLLAAVLGCDRADLYLRWDHGLNTRQSARYVEWVSRRQAHEPVAYLVGERAFYDIDLEVTPDVLIPRPETEHLVDEALAWAASHGQRPLRVLDVGTGSGALAIVLARHLEEARVWAIDVSLAALRVAARNLRRYALGDRVSLVCGDLLRPLRGTFDLILANLPYVPAEELTGLQPDVGEYEPRLALDGGERGVALLREFLAQASAALGRPGLLLVEIDPRQKRELTELARQSQPSSEIRVLPDYAGLSRVLRVERTTCSSSSPFPPR